RRETVRPEVHDELDAPVAEHRHRHDQGRVIGHGRTRGYHCTTRMPDCPSSTWMVCVVSPTNLFSMRTPWFPGCNVSKPVESPPTRLPSTKMRPPGYATRLMWAGLGGGGGGVGACAAGARPTGVSVSPEKPPT